MSKQDFSATYQTQLGIMLAEAIAERGAIPFAQYMQIALYDPDMGYYTRPVRPRFGWEGDYITSIDLHPLFGAAIGRQLAQIWTILGNPLPFIVHEDGAGRGFLGRDIHTWAKDPSMDVPDGFLDSLRYIMRDAGERIWEIEGQDRPIPLEPPHVILSNELIDAFPVHIVTSAANGLQEIYVDVHKNPPYLIERLGPLSEPELDTHLDRYHIPWKKVSQRLASQGCIITIDYGDLAKSLYVSERFRGTLASYRHHHLADNPLTFTGDQDLTAHVNFSSLISVGRLHGLRLAGLTTQRDFLLALGIRKDADRISCQLYPFADTERHTDAGQADYLRKVSFNHKIDALLDPHGIGGFKVLIQHRGMPGLGRQILGLQS
jgi:SAM-dependent MidA family methyltransferase